MERFYRVLVIGFNATERIMLGSIFNLSMRRNPSYRPVEAGEAPHLLLVDGGHPSYVSEALNIIARDPAAVLLIADSDLDTGWHSLARPLHWARLFKALDVSLGFLTHGAVWRQVGARPAPPRYEIPPELAGVEQAEEDLPLPAAADSRAPKASSPGPAAVERVLYVSATAAPNDQVFKAIASIGVQVDVAERGERALEMIEEYRYSCLFVDVALPGIDGYRFCRAVKGRRRGEAPPVVLLKTKASAFERIRASLAGCDAFLAIPANDEELRAVAARLIPGRRHAVPAKVASHV